MEWAPALLEEYSVFVLALQLGPRNPQDVHLLSAHIQQRAKLVKEAPKDSTDGTDSTDMITASQHPSFAKVVYGPVFVRLKALVASRLRDPSWAPRAAAGFRRFDCSPEPALPPGASSGPAAAAS